MSKWLRKETVSAKRDVSGALMGGPICCVRLSIAQATREPRCAKKNQYL